MSVACPTSRAGRHWLRPATEGTVCCVVSALFYTGANICLRRLSQLQADPTWTMCCKETVTPLVLAPLLLGQVLLGRLAWPRPGVLLPLVLASLGVQVVANVGVQWAYGIVGIAVAQSANYGVLLIVGAVMSQRMLREHVSPRAAAALAILLCAIVLLSCGAGAVSRSVSAAPASGAVVALAVAAVCVAGAIYAAFGVSVRHCMNRAAPLGLVMFITTFIGTLTLGPMSLARLGPQILWETTWQQYAWMSAGGGCNVIAFLAIGRGLKLTPVVRVNVLNASQVALAALAGIFMFRESPNPCVVAGIALTIVGMFCVGAPPGQPIADQHA